MPIRDDLPRGPRPNIGHVLKGVFENGASFIGWWTEANFQDWLKAHDGTERVDEDGRRVVCALLTAKQLKEAQWGRT